VWRDLGIIIEGRKSKYGYYSYHIKYISKPPIESIKDDWFASFEMFRLGSRSELLEMVKSIFSKHGIKEIDDEKLLSIGDAEFEQYLNNSFRDILKRMNEI